MQISASAQDPNVYKHPKSDFVKPQYGLDFLLLRTVNRESTADCAEIKMTEMIIRKSRIFLINYVCCKNNHKLLTIK
jgi:hypothetical protein